MIIQTAERRHSDITHITFRYYANRLNKLNQSEINDMKLIFGGKKDNPDITERYYNRRKYKLRHSNLLSSSCQNKFRRNLLKQREKLRFKFVPKLQELHGGSVSARGLERSGIDFGRKVNPTSVATAREAAPVRRGISIPRTREYIYNTLSKSANDSPVHGWQQYLPS